MSERTPKLLVVDDDPRLRDLLRRYLGENGFQVFVADNGVTMNRLWLRERFDALILDLMMPGEDGLQILRRLREQKDTTPIIMLTAKGSEYDTVLGLDSGADDYIPKPFRMMELISRIKARLRRVEDKGAEEYRMGNLYVCPSRYVVTVNQEPVSLTLKEYEMLCLLLKNSGIVLSRTQLLNQIWGYEFDGESRTVDVHIRTLRQKLGEAGDLIETVRGIGYKMGK